MTDSRGWEGMRVRGAAADDDPVSTRQSGSVSGTKHRATHPPSDQEDQPDRQHPQVGTAVQGDPPSRDTEPLCPNRDTPQRDLLSLLPRPRSWVLDLGGFVGRWVDDRWSSRCDPDGIYARIVLAQA